MEGGISQFVRAGIIRLVRRRRTIVRHGEVFLRDPSVQRQQVYTLTLL